MSEQQILQTEKKKGRPRKVQQQQEPKAVIDISAIKGTAEGDYIERITQAAVHEQARRQADTRYAKRVRISDNKVQEIEETLRQQLESQKPGERPKMWIMLKDMLETLKIITREMAVSAAEVAKAIKNVFGVIDPKIDSKSLNKLKGTVKSAFVTCTKHGYEIHSVKIDGVERYFLHRKKEDFDAYRGRKEQRIDNEFQSLDRFIERADKILREQNATTTTTTREETKEIEVTAGAHGETTTMIVESEQTAPKEEQEAEEREEQEDTKDKNQANEGSDK